MALALLLLLGWEPLSDAALRQLEEQYPATSADQDWSAYAGVIVLGGALEPAYVWTVPGQSALNDAAERMTEVLPLLRRAVAGGDDGVEGALVGEVRGQAAIVSGDDVHGGAALRDEG